MLLLHLYCCVVLIAVEVGLELGSWVWCDRSERIGKKECLGALWLLRF